MYILIWMRVMIRLNFHGLQGFSLVSWSSGQRTTIGFMCNFSGHILIAYVNVSCHAVIFSGYSHKFKFAHELETTIQVITARVDTPPVVKEAIPWCVCIAAVYDLFLVGDCCYVTRVHNVIRMLHPPDTSSYVCAQFHSLGNGKYVC